MDEATFFLKTPYVHVSVRPQKVESNAVYCTQRTCVIILLLYVYVYTCLTSVHISPHDTYIRTVRNIKVEFTVVSCRILFFTCPLLSSHLQ